MPLIKVLVPFKFAHRGIDVEEFNPDPDPHAEPRETTAEVAALALHEGWIELCKSPEELAAEHAEAQRRAAEAEAIALAERQAADAEAQRLAQLLADDAAARAEAQRKADAYAETQRLAAEAAAAQASAQQQSQADDTKPAPPPADPPAGVSSDARPSKANKAANK